MENIKIHMMCGKRYFPGWIHIDGGNYAHLDYFDVTNLSQFKENSVDLIYCAHGLEYFDREDAFDVLSEWWRVLKKNSILRLAVPDFSKMATLYTMKKYPLNNFLGPLFGKMKMNDKTIYHKTVYDKNDLEQILKHIGFKETRLWNWQEVEHGVFDDHSQAYLPHLDKQNGELISLNLEAIK